MSQFYEKHIFVCENVRDGENARVSCGKHNAKKIREYLKQKIKEYAPEKKIRVNMSGCLDRCELGPVLVSYPEGHWFTLKTESDVDIFVSKYILQNELSSLQNLQLI
ncbi:MAG: (2Fe-2S) ferredoxin domain-containing protein [Leptospiraceae bacterium]|nr:(2Fe-2S) ferredoxin domain-containing protein [Leptospiraceae bacterium]